jgi:hypothetical protein
MGIRKVESRMEVFLEEMEVENTRGPIRPSNQSWEAGTL